MGFSKWMESPPAVPEFLIGWKIYQILCVAVETFTNEVKCCLI